jgi:hypothetical protein
LTCQPDIADGEAAAELPDGTGSGEEEATMRGPRRVGTATAVLLAVSWAGQDRLAVAGLAVREEPWVILSIEPVLVDGDQNRTLEARTIEIPPRATASMDVRVNWSSGESPAVLHVEASGSAGPDGGPHAVSLRSELRRSERVPFRAERSFNLRDGESAMAEVFAKGERRVVLVLRAERGLRPTIAPPPSAAAPVSFKLEVERKEADRSIPLETNTLRTFVGDPIEYQFHLGEGDSAEEIRLVLTPVRVTGDLCEIRIDVEGTLPGSGTPLLLSRHESIVSSRGASNSVTLVAGEPAAGYRFVVIPFF